MFKKATLRDAKLRLALFGPSGSGKTYTSLVIATGIAQVIKSPIGVIDSERGSSTKYADRFDFFVCELEDKTIESYIKTIKEAEKEFKILIIDSISHAWTELLDYVDSLTQTKFKGNSLMAWRVATPLYREFVNTILSYDGHIIATMRVKTDWTIERTEDGKTKPVKVGLAPEQRSGIEYEFDLLGEMTPEHTLVITKDRSGRFQDKIYHKPDISLGVELASWLYTPPSYNTDAKLYFINELLVQAYGVDVEERKKKILDYLKVNDFTELTDEQKDYVIEQLKEKIKQREGQDGGSI